MNSLGLILEGGGMRGLYTCGVLDFFLDEGIYLSKIYGVSAGACHGSSYISRQKNRALRTVIDYIGNKKYASFYSLLTTGDFFNVDMVYNTIPVKILPFDHDTFSKNLDEFYCVVTNIETGKPEYHPIKDLSKDMIYVQASSSLPLLARNVSINGSKYLDGGISDPIPLEKSIADGNNKNVLILTRHNGYRKEADPLLPLIKLKYRKYPRFVEQAVNRHINYNKTLDLAYEQQKKGNGLIIQPKTPVEIGRLEKDRDKLIALYNSGYNEAKEQSSAIKEFIHSNS